MKEDGGSYGVEMFCNTFFVIKRPWYKRLIHL